MWDLNYKHLHILFTLQVALFRVVWAVGIGDFFNVESVKTDIMNSSKRQTTPWTRSSISPQSPFDGVRLRLENFPPIIVASRSWGPNLVFHWSAAWPSWQPLWWREISFQKFRSLNLGLYFCMDFPSSSELTGYVDLTDSYEIWPKCSLVINAQECEAFLIFQIFSLLRALNLRRSANIKFANLKIDFLGNQLEYRKSLTHFCSLSPTDWRCAVCLVVRASRKAGN